VSSRGAHAADRTDDRTADPTADRATARLTAAVEPVVAAAGYDLEELVVRAAGQRSVVRVVVDRDEGTSLDDVADVSRAISEVLDADEHDAGRAPYVLEVTSPGVDRPLTAPRHWRRNAGRLVTVEIGPEKAREQVTARVLRVDDAGVVLTVEKGGAKKGQVRRAVGERAVPWAELGAGRVQVEFSRPAGHRDAALVVTGPAHDEPDDGLDDETDEIDPLEIDTDEIDELDEDALDERDPAGSGGEQ
jgi:ribosome maturation factor RimP